MDRKHVKACTDRMLCMLSVQRLTKLQDELKTLRWIFIICTGKGSRQHL